ncbi:hypothetical protein BX661DRAFT_196910 [Kickxella alabastrina]|uniref:uncharacterized protein n=1 Tax=Kickxella alabastrina TaxID=61397 RepID=UPI002221130E|nr:uncharacterized protein BX661DRAFT_196910 [Kickxella alabastrina]KAI7833032.1 hypothetical protein BX661DRAFT_196910 [Kickxella alabastrina]KAJ1944616.1 hypothetical protein GGF37_002109 [Kickxella alabastrina]
MGGHIIDIELIRATDNEKKATRLGLKTLANICLVVILLYGGLFYYVHLPKLKSILHTGLDPPSRCWYIEVPTEAPISSTLVTINWTTSCPLKHAIVSYTDDTRDRDVRPSLLKKFSLAALVDTDQSDSWYHYQTTIYAKEGTHAIYSVHTGERVLDMLPTIDFYTA